jgi:hypothetical protein
MSLSDENYGQCKDANDAACYNPVVKGMMDPDASRPFMWFDDSGLLHVSKVITRLPDCDPAKDDRWTMKRALFNQYTQCAKSGFIVSFVFVDEHNQVAGGLTFEQASTKPVRYTGWGDIQFAGYHIRRLGAAV